MARFRRPSVARAGRRGPGGRALPAAAPDTSPDLHDLGVRLLARRELSTVQLSDRLLAHGGDPDAVRAAVERLSGDGLVDDRRYAAAFARTASAVKHRGRQRILRELAQAGVAADIARNAVDAVCPPDDEAERLEREVSRRLRGSALDERGARRLYQALVRQGFDPAHVATRLRVRGRTDTADLE